MYKVKIERNQIELDMGIKKKEKNDSDSTPGIEDEKETMNKG